MSQSHYFNNMEYAGTLAAAIRMEKVSQTVKGVERKMRDMTWKIKEK